MRKTLTIAAREYRAMVATKAFLISLFMMPLMMFGGIIALQAMSKLTKAETLKIAVWDETGQQFAALKVAADQRNAALVPTTALEAGQVDGLPKVDGPEKDGPLPDVDIFELVRIEQEMTDELRLKMSQQIQSKELHAFVEIPSGSLDGPASGQGESQESEEENAANQATQNVVRFYSEGSGLDPVRRWLGGTLNEMVKQDRLQKLGIDAAAVASASAPVEIKSLKPVQKQSDGSISSEEAKDSLTALLLPMGMMLMMFMVIMLAAQPMLESVLEEKSQRIAEVLLGSCNPTQLMSGKLLGTVAGSLTVFAFYAVGGYLFAANQNYLDMVPFDILPWFFLFQVCGVLFYSSIFMAIGSAVSQLKEAQSMMMPVWLMLVLPLMTWFVLVQKPDGALAFWMSMFPPTAPTVMVLRMSTGSTVPVWQILLSLLVLIAATGFCVYLAGRIFRVGILWQGKAPKLTQLLGWALKS